MRVVQFDDYGAADALHIAEAEIPRPGAGELLIEVHAIGVNPADSKWREGMFRDFMPIALPHVPGYEVAGIVKAVGDGVTLFAPGDRVATLLGNTTHGGYAEYVLADAAASAQMPAGLSFELAAGVPVAGLTGAQMIEEHIRPAAGETVLITGAVGAVGRFAVHAALALGARVIAAVRPGQADEARAAGAHEVIALGGDSGGIVFDHVGDTVGGPAVAALCRQMRPGGRICTAATDPIDPTGLPATPEFMFLHQDGPRLAGLLNGLASGALGFPVARAMPLAAAGEAQTLVRNGGIGGKIVLIPSLG
jgi:NADPH:quinone reductase-like Zn-dependent oxidoreductase